jgi:chemotaxis protein CheY-P-specific phosphatase CheC
MASTLLICDDSNLARKQVAKSLPANFNLEIHFAKNGKEGIELIRQGIGDIMFLDLNMPEMDGYEVLQAIREEDLNSMVIVISGDIQPEARTRVKNLGAVEFIKKPIDQTILNKVLVDYGLIDALTIEESAKADAPSAKTSKPSAAGVRDVKFEVNYRDCYQEITNVGMGQAADLLARTLGVFVAMPIPNVNMIEVGEIHMALSLAANENASAVCQGFIGPGIAGEAILFFNDAGIESIAKLMDYSGDIDDVIQRELLMDVGNILIGACLKGIGTQLNVDFSQGHPLILGQHCRVVDMISHNQNRWNKTLAIEVNYKIEDSDISCDLMLLFTEDSIDDLNKRLSYLLED